MKTHPLSLHDRRQRLRWGDEPVTLRGPLLKVPRRPGVLPLLIWFSACALMAYGLVTLALLALGGR